jgi:hypothetical protein
MWHLKRHFHTKPRLDRNSMASVDEVSRLFAPVAPFMAQKATTSKKVSGSRVTDIHMQWRSSQIKIFISDEILGIIFNFEVISS